MKLQALNLIAVVFMLAAPAATGCATLKASAPGLEACGEAAIQKALPSAVTAVEQVLSEQSPNWSQDLDGLLQVLGSTAVCAVEVVTAQLTAQVHAQSTAQAQATFGPGVPVAVRLARARSYRESHPQFQAFIAAPDAGSP